MKPKGDNSTAQGNKASRIWSPHPSLSTSIFSQPYLKFFQNNLEMFTVWKLGMPLIARGLKSSSYQMNDYWVSEWLDKWMNECKRLHWKKDIGSERLRALEDTGGKRENFTFPGGCRERIIVLKICMKSAGRPVTMGLSIFGFLVQKEI